MSLFHQRRGQTFSSLSQMLLLPWLRWLTAPTPHLIGEAPVRVHQAPVEPVQHVSSCGAWCSPVLSRDALTQAGNQLTRVENNRLLPKAPATAKKTPKTGFSSFSSTFATFDLQEFIQLEKLPVTCVLRCFRLKVLEMLFPSG